MKEIGFDSNIMGGNKYVENCNADFIECFFFWPRQNQKEYISF